MPQIIFISSYGIERRVQGDVGQTVMEVPIDLVPAVRELIAKHNK